jgi:hypothetical protein
MLFNAYMHLKEDQMFRRSKTGKLKLMSFLFFFFLFSTYQDEIRMVAFMLPNFLPLWETLNAEVNVIAHSTPEGSGKGKHREGNTGRCKALAYLFLATQPIQWVKTATTTRVIILRRYVSTNPSSTSYTWKQKNGNLTERVWPQLYLFDSRHNGTFSNQRWDSWDLGRTNKRHAGMSTSNAKELQWELKSESRVKISHGTRLINESEEVFCASLWLRPDGWPVASFIWTSASLPESITMIQRRSFINQHNDSPLLTSFRTKLDLLDPQVNSKVVSNVQCLEADEIPQA